MIRRKTYETPDPGTDRSSDTADRTAVRKPDQYDAGDSITRKNLPPKQEKPDGQEEQKPVKKTTLKIIYDVFCLPCSWHAYHDSCSPAESCIYETEYGAGSFRVAIADGLTRSYRPKEYADILTEAFTDGGKQWLTPLGMPILSDKWEINQEVLIRETYYENPELRKFDERLLKHSSASSTLNAVEFGLNTTIFRVYSIGDSVLFDVCDGLRPELYAQYPDMRIEDFEEPPTLLSTSGTYENLDKETGYGFFTTDHVYLLCTAALAKFIIREHRRYRQSEKFQDLLDIQDNDAFMNFCLDQRIEGRLEDEDITMIRIRFVEEKA